MKHKTKTRKGNFEHENVGRVEFEKLGESDPKIIILVKGYKNVKFKSENSLRKAEFAKVKGRR